MRKLVERVRTTVEEFVEQRDDLMMMVSCSDADAPILLKLIEDVEQSVASDVFLFFADDFDEPTSYVAQIVERLREQHKSASEAFVKAGREPLPSFPEWSADDEVAPADRLIEMVSFARSLLPDDGGHRLIWTMFPQKISDGKAYLQLISAFATPRTAAPEIRGVRVIARDVIDAQPLSFDLARSNRVQFTAFDMGPEAIQDALKEETEDDALPDEQRMAALLQNALIDLAHGRNGDALPQLDVLAGYYQSTENHCLYALTLNSIGDMHSRNGDMDQACHWYECAVPPAVKSTSAVMLHTVVKNLADLAYDGKQYERAEQLYDYVDQLAGKMLYVEGMVNARERRGLCNEQLQSHDEAVQNWEAAAQLSRNVELPDGLRRNLEHLSRGYRELHMQDKLASVHQELREIET